MDSDQQPPTTHANSNGNSNSNVDHEDQAQLGGLNRSGTWASGEGQRAEGDVGSSSTPYVSLFSPNIPAIPPSVPSESAGSSRGTHASHSRSLSYSRSMPSLVNHVSMAKRPTRQHAPDERAPIVQLQTQIDRAQKSADDPTTPLEDRGRRRTTLDLMRSEHAVRTDISRLFSESATVSGSRAPSYNNATGPLYLRGNSSRSQTGHSKG